MIPIKMSIVASYVVSISQVHSAASTKLLPVFNKMIVEIHDLSTESAALSQQDKFAMSG